MNIQEIDKWLDNEYGVSYTRLEELHDFVVEQDLKHREEKDKEIERLNNKLLLIKGIIRTPRALDSSLAYAMVKTQIENVLGSDKEC